MERLELLYVGKAKRVFRTESEDLLILEFTDVATAFNGKKKGNIADKGAINNEMSVYLFNTLEDLEIPTHFVQKLGDREMLVKRVEIIPIEVVMRNIVAGSLSKRLGISEGFELETPVLEFYYKSDELGDPMINEYHIMAMKLASKMEMKKIKDLAFKINTCLINEFSKAGLKLVDFKLEFGRYKGQIILADEISPDTCRLWDMKTNEKFDKDRFRRDLGDVEDAYKEALKRLLGGR
ncbi:MAG: phosphoribosylaminoimidazolesuccinocarboxamide synthase [Kosmotoga sp.]|uniref:phosphoribosylaminoimidazolesuccinocarboxamide synthase n=1 Tax=Kosmotoga sp. TaxID=1955248 RepID=UPI001D7249FA|nr:phosphoribosylaminoimidazolesuccinocarboxamide synthase [Kosmotoga sp.]MBO8167220.1 phosphoribosylaminoimidazolesuccinocarboxamide synthase [Kosmotoga sp.]